MEEWLRSKFGHCFIPEGTILFRGHKERDHNQIMFFGMTPLVAGAFHENVQIWKTCTDIEVVFLVESLTERSWAKSAIPALYKVVFPFSNELTDMAIKHENIALRNAFLHKLNKKYGVAGWLSSLEGSIDLEICLVDCRNENRLVIEMTGTYNDGDEESFKNALRTIKIFPTQTFINTTRNDLYNNPYRKYFAYTETWYEELDEQEKRTGKEYNFNLRLKLKV